MWEHLQTANKQVHTALRSQLLNKKSLQPPSKTAVWQVWLCEVRQQIVPDSRSSCTEGSVAQVGLCPTDDKRMSRWLRLDFYRANSSILTGDKTVLNTDTVSTLTSQCITLLIIIIIIKQNLYSAITLQDGIDRSAADGKMPISSTDIRRPTIMDSTMALRPNTYTCPYEITIASAYPNLISEANPNKEHSLNSENW